jgi:putative PIG3 family NAD(P)H quinone oxidoreductase
MTLSNAMLAMEIAAPGGPDVLSPCAVPVPVPGHGQIVIRLAYAGVNRPDVLQRQGLYAPPASASRLPGLEGSGVVVATGPGVTRWEIGDKVCALLPGGGYAEYAACHEAHALPIPKGMSMREAAGLPETAFTVWSNVVMRGGLRAGENFLVHGGSSGIGTMAIQVARALGAQVHATVGAAQKQEICAALGASTVWNYRDDPWGVEAKKIGMDLILCMVGGPYIQQNLAALRDEGRLVQIAFTLGAKAEVNFAELMMRRLTFTGSTLRPQSDLAKARIAAEMERHLWPLIEAGQVRVLIDSEFPLSQAPAAHWRIEASGHVGKIVLKVED